MPEYKVTVEYIAKDVVEKLVYELWNALVELADDYADGGYIDNSVEKIERLLRKFPVDVIPDESVWPESV